MKIATVNVIELVGGAFQGLTAFPETPEGNKEAEEHFGALLKEYNAEPDDIIEKCIEDGRYEGGMGYEVVISHSNTGPKVSAG